MYPRVYRSWTLYLSKCIFHEIFLPNKIKSKKNDVSLEIATRSAFCDHIHTYTHINQRIYRYILRILQTMLCALSVNNSAELGAVNVRLYCMLICSFVTVGPLFGGGFSTSGAYTFSVPGLPPAAHALAKTTFLFDHGNYTQPLAYHT